MNREVIRRYHHINIGDSLIQRIEIDLGSQKCLFLLDRASILKDVANPSIFDPEQSHEPAYLLFEGVLSISCPEGAFYLNATIVEDEATPIEDDLVEFRLLMTGGQRNET